MGTPMALPYAAERGGPVLLLRPRVTTTSRIYLSYFDPQGPATMANSAGGLPRGVPVLLAFGKHDLIFTLFAQAKLPYYDYVWSRLPPNPRHRRITVDADHGSVPSRAVPEVIGWLRALP
jgi:hypothetical protein